MSGRVQSVERAINLLELLGQSEKPLGISELAELSGLPVGTAHRLLKTLAELGYVDYDAETHKYLLGLRVLHLRGFVIRSLNLAQVAMPFMKALMRRVNETVHLAVLNEGEVVYIDRVEGLQTSGMFTQIGKRWYAHCTALGKAMLAFMPDSVWRQVVADRGLPRLSPNTITDPQCFEEELARIRARGYALDNEEGPEVVRCVAAPIRDYTGRVVAAVSVSGPTARIRPERDAELGEEIIRTSHQISESLGYIGD